jgi:formylglycine-generating enzyme required for sulfatase activity
MATAMEPWALWASERSRHVGAALALLVSGLTGFIPQFGGPGYEAALAAGIVLPSAAALMTALEVAEARPGASGAFARGVAVGAVVALGGLVLMLLHGARVGFCDPAEGVLIFLLGPAPGIVLGGVWGGLAGTAVGWLEANFDIRRPRLITVLLALAGPILGMAGSIARFMTSPMVFAFDPFFGVLAGPLYDVVVNVVDRLMTYRLGTLATLGALWLATALHDAAASVGARQAVLERPGVFAVALLCGAGSLAHSLSGPRFGHWNTATSIETALGGHLQGARCDVVHSRGIPVRDVKRFTRDCDRTVPEIEAFFGTRGTERVRVYLFANEVEKGWLMGASHTQIAKPWRGELYVEQAPFPHPVIAHELAHVIAGSFARGPFRIAGTLGGVLPDPGRVEGYAVAAAPDDNDELSSEDWSAAMLKLGVLPPLRSLFQLDFLGVSASKAYTVSGAFVAFLRERYGAAMLRRWYAGERLEALTGGKDLTTLDADFRQALGARPIPERALATAKARFDRPSIFGRKCPRIVDRALGEAAERLGVGDCAAAESGFRQALSLDPGNVDARFGLAGAAYKAGQLDQALGLYAALARDPKVVKPLVVRALETSADIELARGHAEPARRLYETALGLVFDGDRTRTLEVKLLAAKGTGREAVVALLIGDPELGASWEVAAPLIQAWADQRPRDDIPPYLIGRNLMTSGRYAEAARYLDQSLALEPMLPSVRREALRLRVVAAAALEDEKGAFGALGRAVQDPELPAARRAGLVRLLRRTFPRAPLELAAVPAPPAAVKAPSPPPAECPADMQRAPGGKFWVGANPDEGFSDDESPRYLTELAPFCVDETEVTAGAYAACVEEKRCRAPEPVTKILCNYGRPERIAHPMNCIDWALSDAYCKAQGKRLPTEPEFEHVARAGDRYFEYPWGNESPDDRACWKHPGTCAVKTFAAGAFGLYDVSGNVWEWTSDWYGPYPFPPEDGHAKVLRGGSFSRRFEKWMHTRLRERGKPKEGGPHLGFRCVKTLDTEACAFGVESPGVCRHGVLERACPKDKAWNGVRCAGAGEPRCASGTVEKPGHGCVSTAVGEPLVEDVQASAALVTRTPSPEFDADCQTNSRDRPNAFKYVGGSHAARNLVSRSAGCKNRDVGVGWNSTCCP